MHRNSPIIRTQRKGRDGDVETLQSWYDKIVALIYVYYYDPEGRACGGYGPWISVDGD